MSEENFNNVEVQKSNANENNLEKVSRPWQATLLVAFNIISLVMLALMLPFLLLGVGMLSSVIPVGVLGQGKLVFFIMAIFIVLLWLFIFWLVKSLLKGKKWPLYLYLVFTVLGFIGVFYPRFNILSLIWNSFILYLVVVSLRHPFYNQNK